jgi:hypothetical protein
MLMVESNRRSTVPTRRYRSMSCRWQRTTRHSRVYIHAGEPFKPPLRLHGDPELSATSTATGGMNNLLASHMQLAVV